MRHGKTFIWQEQKNVNFRLPKDYMKKMTKTIHDLEAELNGGGLVDTPQVRKILG